DSSQSLATHSATSLDLLLCILLVLSFFSFFFYSSVPHRYLHSFPTRRSSDLMSHSSRDASLLVAESGIHTRADVERLVRYGANRSEEHTSELQSPYDLVCRLLLEKKKKKT